MTARSTFALPRILGGRPANDTPLAPREETLDDLEYAMQAAAEHVDRCHVALEQAMKQHAEAEAAFVARAGRLLYHHTITPAPAEEGE